MIGKNAMRTLSLIGIAMAFALVGSTGVSAEVIFSDSFDRGNSNTVGANDNALGGTVGQTWIEGGDDESIAAGQLNLDPTSGTSWVVADHNFNTSDISGAGGFVLSFTVEPTDTATPTKWAAVSFGHTRQTAQDQTGGSGEFVIVNANGAFGFLIADDGTYQAFDDGAAIDPDNDRGDTGDPLGPYDIVITVLTSDFSAGESASASVIVDGSPVDLDIETPGDQFAYDFTWNTGDNYFNFEGFADSADFDNVKVALVPEPATLALLAAAALPWLKRRR